tara:strand:- start:208 stop:504 length:297 start_codon:yes stop_codon:yes gene_type:complete
MKKIILMCLMIFSFWSCGSGPSAESFQYIVDEYKQVICVHMDKNSSASMSDRTKALSRQIELNKEYEEALLKLSDAEKSKFMMSWALVLSEVVDGNCP